MSSVVSITLKASGISEVTKALKGVKDSLIEIEKATLSTSKSSSKARLEIAKNEAKLIIEQAKAASKVKIEIEKGELKEMQLLAKARLASIKSGLKEEETLLKHAASVKEKLDRGFGRGKSTKSATTGSGGFGSSGQIEFGLGGFDLNLGGIAKIGVAAGGIAVAFSIFKLGIDKATEALKAFGSFVLNDVIKPELKLETRAQQIANRTHETTPAAIQEAARLNRVKYNMSYEDTLGAIEEYGAKGGEHSWRDAPKMSQFVAQYSKAKGYDPKRIAELLGGIRKPGESSEDVINKFLAIEPAMGINIDPEHMASLGRRAKTVGSYFAGSSVDQMSKANALLQVASTGTGSPETAATGMASFFRKIMSDPKVHSHFKKFFTTEGGQEKIKDPFELIRFISEKEHGKLSNLSGLGIKDARAAMNFLAPLQTSLPQFQEQAKKEGLTGKDAEKRALDLWIESLKEGTKDVADRNQIEKDAQAVMATTGEKWETALNQIKDKLVQGNIMEKVGEFVTIFANNADSLGKAALVITNALLSLASLLKTLFPSLKGPGESGSSVAGDKYKRAEGVKKAAADAKEVEEIFKGGGPKVKGIAGLAVKPTDKTVPDVHGALHPVPGKPTTTGATKDKPAEAKPIDNTKLQNSVDQTADVLLSLAAAAKGGSLNRTQPMGAK